VKSIIRHRLTIALVVLNVVLAAAIGNRLWRGTQTALLIATPATHRAVPTLIPDSPATAVWQGTVIQDRALFYASRRFYKPPALAQAMLPRPDYRLLGTVSAPGRPPVALLQPMGPGATRHVKAGDELDGWTVHAVEHTRVILQQNGQQYEIASALGSGGAMLVAPIARPMPALVAGGVHVLGTPSLAPASGPVAVETRPRLYRPPPR